jgi:hypothetical protein
VLKATGGGGPGDGGDDGAEGDVGSFPQAANVRLRAKMSKRNTGASIQSS